MVNLNQTSTELLIEQVRRETEAEVNAKIRIEFAKNLLDVLEDSVIALKTELSLQEVEELRRNS